MTYTLATTELPSINTKIDLTVDKYKMIEVRVTEDGHLKTDSFFDLPTAIVAYRRKVRFHLASIRL